MRLSQIVFDVVISNHQIIMRHCTLFVCACMHACECVMCLLTLFVRILRYLPILLIELFLWFTLELAFRSIREVHLLRVYKNGSALVCSCSIILFVIFYAHTYNNSKQ